MAAVEITHTEIEASPIDSSIDAMISPYRFEMNEKMGVVLGHVAVELSKGRPESTLGNWIADLLYARTSDRLGHEIDFAVQNIGGIRINELGVGPLTLGRIYELMPFDNLITVLKLKGSDVQEFCNDMANTEGWPVSSQLHFVIENEKAVNVTIHGKALDSDKIYEIALPDYVANYGGDSGVLNRAIERSDLNYLVRDAIIDEVKRLTSNGDSVAAKLDGRVTNK